MLTWLKKYYFIKHADNDFTAFIWIARGTHTLTLLITLNSQVVHLNILIIIDFIYRG